MNDNLELTVDGLKPRGSEPSFARSGLSDDFSEAEKMMREARRRAAADMLMSIRPDEMSDGAVDAYYQGITGDLFPEFGPDTDGSKVFGSRRSADMRKNLSNLRLVLQGQTNLLQDRDLEEMGKLPHDEQVKKAEAEESGWNKFLSWAKGERGEGLLGSLYRGLMRAPTPYAGSVTPAGMAEAETRDVVEPLDQEKERAAYEKDLLADYVNKRRQNQPLLEILSMRGPGGLSDRGQWVLTKSLMDGKIDVIGLQALSDDEQDRVMAGFGVVRGDKTSGLGMDFSTGTAGDRFQMGIYGLANSIASLGKDVYGAYRDAAMWLYGKSIRDEAERRDYFEAWGRQARADIAAEQQLPEGGFWGEAYQTLMENLHWTFLYGGGRGLAKLGGKIAGKAAGVATKVEKAKSVVDRAKAVEAARGARAVVDVEKSAAVSRRLGEITAKYSEELRKVALVEKKLHAAKGATDAAIVVGRGMAYAAFAEEFLTSADMAGISREDSVLLAAFVGFVNERIERIAIPGLENNLTRGKLGSMGVQELHEAVRHGNGGEWLFDYVRHALAAGGEVAFEEGTVEEPLQQIVQEWGKRLSKGLGEMREKGEITELQGRSVFDALVGAFATDFKTYVDTTLDMLPAMAGYLVTSGPRQQGMAKLMDVWGKRFGERKGGTPLGVANVMRLNAGARMAGFDFLTGRDAEGEDATGETPVAPGESDTTGETPVVPGEADATGERYLGEKPKDLTIRLRLNPETGKLEDASGAKGGQQQGETASGRQQKGDDDITPELSDRYLRAVKLIDAGRQIYNQGGYDKVGDLIRGLHVDQKLAETLADLYSEEYWASKYSPQNRAAVQAMSLADISEESLSTLPGFVKGSYRSNREKGFATCQINVGKDITDEGLRLKNGNITLFFQNVSHTLQNLDGTLNEAAIARQCLPDSDFGQSWNARNGGNGITWAALPPAARRDIVIRDGRALTIDGEDAPGDGIVRFVDDKTGEEVEVKASSVIKLANGQLADLLPDYANDVNGAATGQDLRHEVFHALWNACRMLVSDEELHSIANLYLIGKDDPKHTKPDGAPLSPFVMKDGEIVKDGKGRPVYAEWARALDEYMARDFEKYASGHYVMDGVEKRIGWFQQLLSKALDKMGVGRNEVLDKDGKPFGLRKFFETVVAGRFGSGELGIERITSPKRSSAKVSEGEIPVAATAKPGVAAGTSADEEVPEEVEDEKPTADAPDRPTGTEADGQQADDNKGGEAGKPEAQNREPWDHGTWVEKRIPDKKGWTFRCRLRVVNAIDGLLTSWDEGFNQQFQKRETGHKGNGQNTGGAGGNSGVGQVDKLGNNSTERKIRGMAANMDYYRAGRVDMFVTMGAPMVAPNGRVIDDGTVEEGEGGLHTLAGNHRAQAIRLMYAQHMPAAAGFREKVLLDAAQRGLTVDEHAAEAPIIICELYAVVVSEGEAHPSLEEIAQASNQGGFGEFEKAKHNADILIKEGLIPRFVIDRKTGKIVDAPKAKGKNAKGDPVSVFWEKLSQNERDENKEIIDDDGNLTEKGQRLFLNAITYALIGESSPEIAKTIINGGAELGIEAQMRALMTMTPEILAVVGDKAKQRYDIRRALGEALDWFVRWRKADTKARVDAGKEEFEWRTRKPDGTLRNSAAMATSWENYREDLLSRPGPEAEIIGDMLAASERAISYGKEGPTDVGKRRAHDLIVGYVGDYLANVRAAATEEEGLLGLEVAPPTALEMLEAQRKGRFSVTDLGGLYHGSATDWLRPDLSSIGSGQGEARHGTGFNVTTDRDTAETFGRVAVAHPRNFLEKAGVALFGKSLYLYETSLKAANLVGWREDASEYVPRLQEAVDARGFVQDRDWFAKSEAGMDVRSLERYLARVRKPDGARLAPREKAELMAEAGIDATVHAWPSADGALSGKVVVVYNLDKLRVDHKWKDGRQRFSVAYSPRPATAEEFAAIEGRFGSVFAAESDGAVTNWMLPNGRVLNPAPGASHNSVMYVLNRGSDIEDVMASYVDMLNGGAVRVKPAQGFEFLKRPNEVQFDALYDLVEKQVQIAESFGDDPIYIDVDDEQGGTLFTVEYGLKTSPSRIIGDLRTWFDEGILPEGAYGALVEARRTGSFSVAPQGVQKGAAVEYPDAGMEIRALSDATMEKGLRWSVGRLYTGSAADYEKPSLHYVGTGEGSQVYGWGLYASSERGVAESYLPQKDQIERANQYREYLKRRIAEQTDPHEKDHLEFELKEAEKAKPTQSLYEQTFFTNRAPGDESHLLNWYEPVDESILKNLQDELNKKGIEIDFSILETNGYIGDEHKPTGGEVYELISSKMGSPKAASEWLSAHDIDGIKYPVDSYGAGKTVKDGDTAGWNYVSFRDDNIRVDHKWVDGQQHFSVGARRRAEYRNLLLRKRPDLANEDAEAYLDEIAGYETAKKQKLAVHWLITGAIELPEDAYKLDKAIATAERAKIDPFQYRSPEDIFAAFPQHLPKDPAIDPDTVPELTNKTDMGHGVTVYNVDEGLGGQKSMRRIINTHWGKDANPWCLLQADSDGNLSAEALHYWMHYNALPKKVAFLNGRLLSFMATEGPSESEFAEDEQYQEWLLRNDFDEEDAGNGIVPTFGEWRKNYIQNVPEQWWDRKDASHDGIPIEGRIEGDALGRSGIQELKDGKLEIVGRTWRGDRKNGKYEEWQGEQKSLEAEFKDGRPVGWRRTYRNGELAAVEHFNEKGEHDQPQVFFNGDGGVSYIEYEGEDRPLRSVRVNGSGELVTYQLNGGNAGLAKIAVNTPSDGTSIAWTDDVGDYYGVFRNRLGTIEFAYEYKKGFYGRREVDLGDAALRAKLEGESAAVLERVKAEAAAIYREYSPAAGMRFSVRHGVRTRAQEDYEIWRSQRRTDEAQRVKEKLPEIERDVFNRFGLTANGLGTEWPKVGRTVVEVYQGNVGQSLASREYQVIDQYKTLVAFLNLAKTDAQLVEVESGEFEIENGKLVENVSATGPIHDAICRDLGSVDLKTARTLPGWDAYFGMACRFNGNRPGLYARCFKETADFYSEVGKRMKAIEDFRRLGEDVGIKGRTVRPSEMGVNVSNEGRVIGATPIEDWFGDNLEGRRMLERLKKAVAGGVNVAQLDDAYRVYKHLPGVAATELERKYAKLLLAACGRVETPWIRDAAKEAATELAQELLTDDVVAKVVADIWANKAEKVQMAYRHDDSCFVSAAMAVAIRERLISAGVNVDESFYKAKPRNAIPIDTRDFRGYIVFVDNLFSSDIGDISHTVEYAKRDVGSNGITYVSAFGTKIGNRFGIDEAELTRLLENAKIPINKLNEILGYEIQSATGPETRQILRHVYARRENLRVLLGSGVDRLLGQHGSEGGDGGSDPGDLAGTFRGGSGSWEVLHEPEGLRRGVGEADLGSSLNDNARWSIASRKLDWDALPDTLDKVIFSTSVQHFTGQDKVPEKYELFKQYRNFGHLDIIKPEVDKWAQSTGPLGWLGLYLQGKYYGDLEAARKVVRHRISSKRVNAVRTVIGTGEPVRWLYVRNDDGRRTNRLPQAYAEILAEHFGGTVDDGIVKVSDQRNTSAGMKTRAHREFEFAGEPAKGARYVIVDDVWTTGQTTVSLLDYLVGKGADVRGITTMAVASHGSEIKPTKERIAAAVRKSQFATVEEANAAVGLDLRKATGSELQAYFTGARSNRFGFIDWFDPSSNEFALDFARRGQMEPLVTPPVFSERDRRGMDLQRWRERNASQGVFDFRGGAGGGGAVTFDRRPRQGAFRFSAARSFPKLNEMTSDEQLVAALAAKAAINPQPTTANSRTRTPYGYIRMSRRAVEDLVRRAHPEFANDSARVMREAGIMAMRAQMMARDIRKAIQGGVSEQEILRRLPKKMESVYRRQMEGVFQRGGRVMEYGMKAEKGLRETIDRMEKRRMAEESGVETGLFETWAGIDFAQTLAKVLYDPRELEDGREDGTESPEGEDAAGGASGGGAVELHGVKLRAEELEDPRQFAQFVVDLGWKYWKERNGLGENAVPWGDNVSVQFMRRTAQNIYRQLVRDIVYSGSRETVTKYIDKFETVPTIQGLVSAMAFAGSLIHSRRILETKQKMCEEIDTLLKTKLGAKGRFKPDQEELRRKVSAELQLRAMYMRHAMWLTKKAAAEEALVLCRRLDQLAAQYEETERDFDQSKEHREIQRKLNILREFGSLRYRPIGEIENAKRYWEEAARGSGEEILEAMRQREVRTQNAADILAAAVVNPRRGERFERGAVKSLNDYAVGHMGFVSMLQDMVRYAKGPEREAAETIIHYIALEIQKAGDRARLEQRQNADAFHRAVESIYGRKFDKVMVAMNARDERFAPFLGTRGGKAVKPTKARAMQLLVSLLQGRKPGDSYYENVIRYDRQSQARAISDLLTAEDLAMIGWIGDWYERNRKDLSDICEALFGIGVYSESPNYFPVKMLMEQQGLESAEGVGWSAFPKALTPRVKNERDFDTSMDIFSMWMSRALEGAQWKAHAKLGLEMRGIFGRSSLQEAINANHGAKVNRMMLEFISDILSGSAPIERTTSGVEQASDWVRGWTALTALGGNVGVMFKQTTSIPAFGFEIGLRNTARHIVTAFTPEGIDAMGKIWSSEQRKTRWDVGSSEAVANALRQRNATALKRLLQAAMITNKLGDVVPGLVVGQGIYRDCIEQGMSEEDAMAETWMIVERTQQSSRLENQIKLQRRQKLGRMMFQFLSTQQQYLQYEMRALRELWANPNTDTARKAIRTVLLNHVILTSLYFWMGELYKAMLGQEPPEDQFAQWMISNLMGPFGSLFVLGFMCKATLDRIFSGKSYGRSVQMIPLASFIQGMVNDTSDVVEAVFSNDKSWEDVLEEGMQMLEHNNSTVRDARKIDKYRLRPEAYEKK